MKDIKKPFKEESANIKNLGIENYWINTFSDKPGKSIFPYDKTRKDTSGYIPAAFTFCFTGELYNQLMKLSNNSLPKLQMLLTAGLAALLYKYTANRDIIVGTSIYKQEIEAEFINSILPLRIPIHDGIRFKELVRQVRETIREANEYQNYPVEKLLQTLKIPYSKNDDFPLFDVVILVENIQDKSYIEHINPNMAFYFQRTDDSVECRLQYDTLLYETGTIKRIVAHTRDIMQRLMFNVDVEIQSINILTDEEKRKLLVEFNDTRAGYPKDMTITGLFDQQVEKTPDHTAVICGEKQATYKELRNKANRLSAILRAKGAAPDTITAIMSNRSLELIIGILGVLKAGAAFLPLDPEIPAGRNEFIIKDSNTSVLLAQEPLIEKNQGAFQHFAPGSIIPLDKIDEITNNWNNGGKQAKSRGPASGPKNLAYIIYTSGTTGRPKGVMISHQAILNYICWASGRYVAEERVNFPLYTSVSFDLTMTSIFTPLVTGNAVVVYKEEEKALVIEEIIHQDKVDAVKLTPSHLKLIREGAPAGKVSSIKRFIVGGEELETELAADISRRFNGTVEIYNEYGPTEAAVGCMIYKFDARSGRGRSVPIGKPIHNTEIYILDEHRQPVPYGVPGELYISGEGVALGYLGREELTSERFFENPFVKGRRMYRSGDLARWLPNGNIEFLGRLDNQVKIRGHRIELAEIENRLLSYDEIKETVVIIPKLDDDDKCLCAYFVSDKELEPPVLRDYLLRELPDYMVPLYFVRIKEIPLTLNGKTDLKRLPHPELKLTPDYVPPRNTLEERLVKLWAKVLGVERRVVGIDTNFFEVGGNSLKATILLAKIHKELSVKMPLGKFFKTPWIRALAVYIGGVEKDRLSGIEPIEKKEYYPLSSAQKRLYFIQTLDLNNTSYNLPLILPLGKDSEINKLESSIKRLVTHHESLRTSFKMIKGVPVQRVHEAADIDFTLDYYQCDEAEAQTIVNNFIKPFDLGQPSLIRSGLIELPDGNHVWMVDIHHIVSDGTSLTVLTEDFLSLYKGMEPGPLRIQYKDYSQWQERLFEKSQLNAHENYWLERFADSREINRLNLPADYSRPNVFTFAGGRYDFILDDEAARDFKALGSRYGATLFMNFLAALNILFYKYTGQQDIIIGTAIAGRPHADLQSVIGMFVNMLAMRNYPAGEKSYKAFLVEVTDNSLKAFENQEVQFEDLVDKLELVRDPSRNPLFDVSLVAQNFRQVGEGDKDHEQFNLYETLPTATAVGHTVGYENITSIFDMSVFVSEQDEGDDIVAGIRYYTGIFKESTIRRMVGHLKQVIKAVTKHPEIKLKDISILTEDERKQILETFNNTRRDYPGDKTINQLFEEQVQRTPDHTCIVYKDNRLTYKHLNIKANRLVRVLSAKGVNADTIVGIMLERSIEMIAGILGILKAGGAYLPIDPGYPRERIDYMLKDSGAKLLVTAENLEELPDFPLLPATGHRPPATSLAYIIYTSGSSGTPKGVLTAHYNVTRVVRNTNYIDLTPVDRVLQLSNYAFDGSVFDIYGALLNGSVLVLMQPQQAAVVGPAAATLEKECITVFFVTTALFNLLVDESPGFFGIIRKVLFGGEKVSVEHTRKALGYSDKGRIIHMYGPTETTVYSTFYNINTIEKNADTIPIGAPLSNTAIYILDNHLKPVPIGVIGELYIGGCGTARGYLNRPELTAEKFITSLFVPGDRLYKTGDMAKWLPDGNIIFLGRIDQQVKIRGFRIELGEIESQLLKIKGIRQACVLERTRKSGERYLCAYFAAGQPLAPAELRNFLKIRLPDYMLPSHFIPVERIPLTPNGKIDKQMLLAVEASPTPDYIAPESKTEKIIANIWKEILELDKVGAYDNFFEVGGTSLDIIQVTNRMKETFNRDIPIVIIFQYPAIRALAEYIDRDEAENRLAGEDRRIAPERSTPDIDENMDSIAAFLSKTYDTPVYYRKYRLDNRTYRVLFITHEPFDIETVLTNIANAGAAGNINIGTYPNYIAFNEPGNREPPENGEIDARLFAKMVGLKERVSTENLALMEKEISQNSRSSYLLKKNTLNREYELAPIQKFFLLFPHEEVKRNYFYYYTDFVHSTDMAEIRRILTEFIQGNSLFRSVIIQEKGNYFIREYGSFANIRVPFLDIAPYSPACRDDIILQMNSYFSEPMELFDHPLFRAVILKEDHTHWRLMLLINHLINDGASIGILDKQFHDLKHKIQKRQKKGPSISDYYDYVHFMKKQNYDHLDLNKYLNFQDYKRSIAAISKKYKAGAAKNESFEVDISIIPEEFKKYYNEIAFWVLAKVIGDLFAVDKVPIEYIYNARVYKDGTFGHIAGDLHDSVPVIVSLDEEPLSAMERFIAYKRFIRENNLNFMNYFFKGYVADWSLEQMMSPFSFNSLMGSYDFFKEKLMPVQETIVETETPGHSSPDFSVYLLEDFSANKLWISFTQNSGFSVKEMFKKNYFHLVSSLNKKNSV